MVYSFTDCFKNISISEVMWCKKRKSRTAGFFKMTSSVSRFSFKFFRSVSKLSYPNHILLQENADFVQIMWSSLAPDTQTVI